MILLLANLEKIFGGWRSWRLLTYCLACGVQWIKFPAVLWVFRSTASFGLTYLVWVTPVGALGYLMICPQKLVLAFEAFAQQEHDTVLYVKFVELIQNLSVYAVCIRELRVMLFPLCACFPSSQQMPNKLSWESWRVALCCVFVCWC